MENENVLGKLITYSEGFVIEIYHHIEEGFIATYRTDGKSYYNIGEHKFGISERLEDNEFKSLDDLVEAIQNGHYDIRHKPEYDKKVLDDLISGKINPEVGNLEHIKVMKALRHMYLQATAIIYTDAFYDEFEISEHEWPDFVEYDLPDPNLPLPYIDDDGDMFGIEKGVFSLLEEDVKEDQIGSELYQLCKDNYKHWS